MSERYGKTYIGMKAYDMGFDAHLTLLYLGELTYEQEYNIENSLIESVYPLYSGPTYVKRLNFDVFGNLIVLKVQVLPEVYQCQELLSNTWKSPSTFPFNPHITIKMPDDGTDLVIPTMIKLDHLGLY